MSRILRESLSCEAHRRRAGERLEEGGLPSVLIDKFVEYLLAALAGLFVN